MTRTQTILSEFSLNFLFIQSISIEIQNTKIRTPKVTIIKTKITPKIIIPPKRPANSILKLVNSCLKNLLD